MNDPSVPSRTKPSASDMVLTLNQVRGIYASCVVLDAERNVDEIHIVASTDRKPKQIVRDVETVLFVKHGTKIDYRKISMVQITDAQPLLMPVARTEIRRVWEDMVGDQRRIRVELQGASRLVVGEAYERIDHPTSYQSSAKATLNAIEKMLDRKLNFQLEDAQIFGMGSREILIVVVKCLFENREETFAGTSFVGPHLIEAGARATLDALNRRIHNLTVQSPRESETDQ